MNLRYPQKRALSEILRHTEAVGFDSWWDGQPNALIHGENLSVLKALLDSHHWRGKVDLVYIDPPFATNNEFTIGEDRVSTISNSAEDLVAYRDKLAGSEFIEFLRERLLLLRELMSNRASIYLHIDYKIGHYVKVMMDEVFGITNFRNDITRIKCNPKNFQRRAYGNVKDLILYYTKTREYTWNEPREKFLEEDVDRLFKKVDEQGRRYTTIPLHAPGETLNGVTGQEFRGIKPPKGRHWRSDPKLLEQLDDEGLIEWSSNGVPRRKIFADESDGKRRQDVWEFKDPQYPVYPTEKNLELIKLIIATSSNPGDLVMDCFCGSGGTLQAAQELERYWLGVDQSEEAIKVALNRINSLTPLDSLFSQADFKVLRTASRTGILACPAL